MVGCSSCNNTGSQSCDSCHGKGCGRCNGSGRTSNKGRPCLRCKPKASGSTLQRAHGQAQAAMEQMEKDSAEWDRDMVDRAKDWVKAYSKGRGSTLDDKTFGDEGA
eukprot:TRINITY_DN16685_c0_g1_i1.p3 TRINITY_DN16685_c0_g1~~TRINITY_DN16685_c0_g1_i1.p3  ORF type:complete len:114 (+),score=6.74 TRINITY_DN16685_c0_g1_i1:26-343(+)